MSDANRGREALTYFHNASVGYPGYNFTVDTLAAAILKSPDVFLDGLGFAINTVGMSSGDVQNAMEELARQSRGRVPNANSFFNYIRNQATQISYLDLAKDVTVYTAEKLGEGAQEIGKQVLFTGNLLLFALPLIVGYIVWANVKKVT